MPVVKYLCIVLLHEGNLYISVIFIEFSNYASIIQS